MMRTPYGARITWKLPGGNDLVAHLKDKDKIRHKKRWSQVMYMNYILKWKLKKEFGKSGYEDALENTFILALDGDVEFEPEAVLSLMRRMKKSKIVGAACGRIHPIGSGPMVWYQQFEYAISHWLQKATEHVIGCVLCSPGCFSLFRGSAIINSGILKTYTSLPSEAKHHVQYDQGEDRWLCTLLLKKGWKIEYCAESDSYTFAPEGFYEFFNQRRRWTPSTMANILDLILDYKNVTKTNQNISFLYIVYHIFLFVSTLLTPGSIFMLILGAIILGFEAIPPWLALILNLIPVGIFILLCLYASSQKQLQYAAVLSGVYVIVMVIVMIGVIRDALNEGLCSVTTILLLFVAGVFVISAFVHPKEFLCIMPGLLYFVAIPSMSMLMFLYSIGNLHVVSWGTRETKQKTESDSPKKIHTPEKEETGYFCSLGNFVSCIFCPTNKYTKEDFIYTNMLNEVNVLVNKNENQEEEGKSEIDKEHMEEVADGSNKCTEKRDEIKHLEEKKEDKEKDDNQCHYYADETYPMIGKKELKFWNSTIERYLMPLETKKEEEIKVQEELIELRNKVSLFVYLLNAILVTVMFGLTQVNTFKDSLSISILCDNNPVAIVPIALLFAVVFGLLLLIQFLGMLYHRFSTLIHIAASTDIRESYDIKEAKKEKKVFELLTSPEASSPPKHEPSCDKAKIIPNGNRQVLKENIEPVKDLDAVVGENLKGALFQKYQKKLVEQVLGIWKKNAKNVNDDKPGMLQLVQAATKQKLIGHKSNKHREEDAMTEIPANKRPNGNKVKPIDSPEHKNKISSSSISSQKEDNVRKENGYDSLSESYNGPDTNDSNV
ncbi:chitin synthase chs-2-like [Mytilus trossulus]|uniref:chitin synthase chs-2-like n=1 Tax=Mytilus trossulus TaxID=6551 RepID=UPI003004D907